MKLFLIILTTLFLLAACQPKDVNSEAVDTPLTEPVKEPKKEVTLKPCTKEAKQCPNGRAVVRNPRNNCEFDPCDPSNIKKQPVMCPTDVKECPDGSFVSRDHYNNCKFKECPASEK